MASWITPATLDANNISVVPLSHKNSSDIYDRSRILYKYSERAEPKDLVITVDRDVAAYIKCRGVQKDVFTQGDKRIVTNRYGAQFVLYVNNDAHTALYEAFEKIKATVETLTGCNASFPVKDLEEYSVLYTNLIHANDGKMYSTAYTDNEPIDIINCKQCIVRPAFLLSILKKSTTEVKIRIQVSQMYVHEFVAEFPLANLD